MAANGDLLFHQKMKVGNSISCLFWAHEGTASLQFVLIKAMAGGGSNVCFYIKCHQGLCRVCFL